MNTKRMLEIAEIAKQSAVAQKAGHAEAYVASRGGTNEEIELARQLEWQYLLQLIEKPVAGHTDDVTIDAIIFRMYNTEKHTEEIIERLIDKIRQQDEAIKLLMSRTEPLA